VLPIQQQQLWFSETSPLLLSAADLHSTETTIGQIVRSIQRLLPSGCRVRQRKTPPRMFKGRKEKNPAVITHVHRCEPRVGARGGARGKGACPANTFKVNLGRALLSGHRSRDVALARRSGAPLAPPTPLNLARSLRPGIYSDIHRRVFSAASKD
jgi:hypothetical protein